MSLLQKLFPKKILEEATLTDNDLVYLNPKLDRLLLVKDGRFYVIKEYFSEIDHSNPKVSLICLSITKKTAKEYLEKYRPYKEVRSSS